MDKLKALLKTEEVSQFSMASGSKLLGEFAKKYPTAFEHMQSKHISTSDNLAKSEEELNQFNATIDSIAELTEQIYAILGDFFVKALEVKEKEKLPKWSAPDSLIASRVLQMTIGIGSMLLLDNIKDSKMDIVSPFIELSPEKMEEYKKMYALKRFSDLMSIQLSNTMGDMLNDIIKVKQ